MDWIMEDGKITHLIFTDINIPKMPIMLMNQLVPHVIFNEIVMLLFQIVNMKPEITAITSQYQAPDFSKIS